MAISMLKIRRPLGRLIFNMGIAIPGKTVFLIETAPRAYYDFILKAHTAQYIKGVSIINQKALNGLFSNLAHTLIVIVITASEKVMI